MIQPNSKTTVGNVLTQITDTLSSSPSARLDAEILVCFSCQFTRAQLITHDQSEISPDDYNHLQQLVARRKNGEPIAHITGQREFYSLNFSVNEHTLIPRPETELLVDLALERIPENQKISILDLGTGSGAIALSVAKHRPQCKVVATDKSEQALKIAKKNTEILKIENIELIQSDWFDELQTSQFNIIISNPPYIAKNDEHLSQGDVRFEPETALVSGTDGLDDIRLLARNAGQFLLPDGILMLEHGATQAKDLHSILSDAGGTDITCYQDLAGLDRVTTCKFK